MHEFNSDFYGCDMKALVLGYIRPELDYISRGQSIIEGEC
jgi:riboflavin kinase